MQNISVFIFAHQDDEFGVYAEIIRLIKNDSKVIVLHLTSGSLDGKPRPDRNCESLNVLRDIGVMQENIYFLGSDIYIPAARMYEYLDTIYTQILKLLTPIDKITSLYFLS